MLVICGPKMCCLFLRRSTSSSNCFLSLACWSRSSSSCLWFISCFALSSSNCLNKAIVWSGCNVISWVSLVRVVEVCGLCVEVIMGSSCIGVVFSMLLGVDPVPDLSVLVGLPSGGSGNENVGVV